LPGALRLRDVVINPPLLNASGAFDLLATDPDWRADPAAAAPLGAYVTKTVTAEARSGNPRPWVELLAPETLVNSVGLANPGFAEVGEQWRELPDTLGGIPVILSLGGCPEELAAMAGEVSAHVGWVAGLELNLSCPNVHGGNVLAAADPARAAASVAAVRAVTDLPMLVKLTAACGDIGAVATAAESAGADGLVAVNTMPVRALDDDGWPVLGSPDGGMSGAMLHPIALRAVAACVAAVAIPVIGVGGVSSSASARRMFATGARAIGVGTAAALAPSTLRDLAHIWDSP